MTDLSDARVHPFGAATSNGAPHDVHGPLAIGIHGQPLSSGPVNPLGVLALGGKATDVLLQLCDQRASRHGDFMDVMVPMAMDTDAGSLSRLPAGLQVRLGEETSAPEIAGLMASPLFEFIAKRVAARLCVKSGRQTALGSNQVPAAPLGMGLYEHRSLYHAIENFVQRVRALPVTSKRSAMIGRAVVVILGSDNGAVGRGLSRHVTRLVRMAMDRCGEDFTLFHVALWGSNFEHTLPDPVGAAAAEMAGALETALDAVGELTLPAEIDLDQQASGPAADFNIVLSGKAFRGDEGLWKQHAARAVDLLATPAGQKIAAIWRNT